MRSYPPHHSQYYTPPPPPPPGAYHHHHVPSYHSHHRSHHHHPPSHLQPARLSKLGMFSNVAVAAAESEEIGNSAGGGAAAATAGPLPQDMLEIVNDNSPSASTISTKASLAVGPSSVGQQQFNNKSGRRQSQEEDEDVEDGSSPHRMIHSAHQLLSLSSSNDQHSQQQQQQKSNHPNTNSMISREEENVAMKDDDDAVVADAKRRKLSDLDDQVVPKGPSPTMALDGRVMAPGPGLHHHHDNNIPISSNNNNRTTTESPAAASKASVHSHQSLDLGAIPSWESAGKPLGGWSVNSGMMGDATLLGTAFSFSDSLAGGRTSAVSAKQQQEESDNNSSGDDPSPKSILSKVGEKRKSLAPGTHVQFSRDAGGALGVSRKRTRDVVPPPPPPPPEEYDYYYAPRYPRPPPPHSRHPYPPHGYYPAEEDAHYYGHHHYGPYPPPPYGYAPPPPHRRQQHRGAEYPPPPPSAHQHPAAEGKRDDYMPTTAVGETERTIHKPQFSSSYGDPGKKSAGGGNWTKEEDKKLLEIMKKIKNPKHYEPLAKKLNNACGGHKSGFAVKDRWTRYLKPGSRKGQWTDEEDAAVVNAVTNSTEEAFTRWSDLALTLPGRVGKQVRDRWVNHLNPAINHNPFSREDDLLLWEGHRLIGKRWVEISTKFFKGSRSENHIKNRWYSAAFKKIIAKEMGPDAYRLGNDGVSHDRKKRKTEVVPQLRGLVRSHGAHSSRPPAVSEHYSEGYHEGRTSSGGHYYETR